VKEFLNSVIVSLVIVFYFSFFKLIITCLNWTVGCSKKLKDYVSYGRGCVTVTGTPYWMVSYLLFNSFVTLSFPTNRHQRLLRGRIMEGTLYTLSLSLSLSISLSLSLYLCLIILSIGKQTYGVLGRWWLRWQRVFLHGANFLRRQPSSRLAARTYPLLSPTFCLQTERNFLASVLLGKV